LAHVDQSKTSNGICFVELAISLCLTNTREEHNHVALGLVGFTTSFRRPNQSGALPSKRKKVLDGWLACQEPEEGKKEHEHLRLGGEKVVEPRRTDGGGLVAWWATSNPRVLGS
jgi:hypothetical protein